MIAPSNAVKMKLEETKSRPEPVIANREKAGEFNKKGLFIGGAPKSGTSLLMSLLDNHPQLIVLPEETFYLEDRHKFLALNGYEARLSWLLEKNRSPLAISPINNFGVPIPNSSRASAPIAAERCC